MSLPNVKKVKFQVTMNVTINVPPDHDEREILSELDMEDTALEIDAGKLDKIELLDFRRVD